MNIALDIVVLVCVSGGSNRQLVPAIVELQIDHAASSSACFNPWQSRQLGCPDLSGGKKRKSGSFPGTLMLPPILVTLRLTVRVVWGAGAAKIICWLAWARTCWFARKTGIMCSWTGQTGSYSKFKLFPSLTACWQPAQLRRLQMQMQKCMHLSYFADLLEVDGIVKQVHPMLHHSSSVIAFIPSIRASNLHMHSFTLSPSSILSSTFLHINNHSKPLYWHSIGLRNSPNHQCDRKLLLLSTIAFAVCFLSPMNLCHNCTHASKTY